MSKTKTVYRVISEGNRDRFTKSLNEAVELEWSIQGEMSTSPIENGTKYSILLYKSWSEEK